MNNIVWTPSGPEIGGLKRGLVGGGEVLHNFKTKETSVVTAGEVGKDTIPTDIGEDGTYGYGKDVNYDPRLEEYDNVTGIAGNDIDITDPYRRTFAQQARIPALEKQRIEQKRDLAIQKTNKYAKLSSLYRKTSELEYSQSQKLIDQKTAQVEDILNKQKNQHEFLNSYKNDNLMLADGGKDNKYARGKIPTFARMLPTLTGVGAGLAQLAHWGGNSIRRINTYQQNPFGNRALNILGNMRNDPYPAVQGALDAERRASYGINRSGGLSGSQRYLGRVAQSIGNMQNIANIYQDSDKQNKTYQTAYANALLQEGNSIAQRKQQALQHDWTDYVASHGAKTKGIEQAAQNIVGQVAGGFKNEFQYRTFQDTLDLYLQDLKNNRMTGTWSPMNAYVRSPYIYGDDMYNINGKKTG